MAEKAVWPFVMIAEDDADDRLMMTEAFTERCRKCRLCFAQDGAQLIRFLTNQSSTEERGDCPGGLPDLLLLDLNMPLMDGREALRLIKANPALRHIPTVVMTTSDDEDDIRACYDAGADAYIVKPSSYSELLDIISSLKSHWTKTVHLAEPKEAL